jgi:hypothetical protein
VVTALFAIETKGRVLEELSLQKNTGWFPQRGAHLRTPVVDVRFGS